MPRRFFALFALAALSPAAATSATVTVDQAITSAKVLVYDLPDAENRAEAVRFVETVRDRVLKGYEIVDASALDAAALRQKLKGGFILFTTLDSRSKLLALTTAPLKWRLAAGRLKWDDLDLAVSGLRIALVGRNPYGEGHAVVFAAGSNALVAKAGEVRTGPASFHVYDGAKLVREGFYDEKFRPQKSPPAMPQAAAWQSLVINNEGQKSKVIVYELPEEAGRAEAVRYIEMIRDRFAKGREIVDARALDEAALREKLKDGFTLYTTLSDGVKLLPRAVEPLHWELAGGRLKWGDVNAAVAGLRIVLVGKNPYGDGTCVVYAAGSNSLVAKANNVFHGPASYHIYDGEALLKEGFYDERFVSHERITRAQAAEDMRDFFATLEMVHPKLLAHVSRADYERLKREVNEEVERKLDAGGEIVVQDFAWVLYRAAAFFQDGHTSLAWQGVPSASGHRFPPFVLQFDDGAFVIAAAKDPALAGMELVSVNGTPAVEFFRPILERCSAETMLYKATRFVEGQSFWLSMSKLFDGASSYRLKLRDMQGHESEAAVETVRLREYQDLLAKSHVNWRLGGGTHVEFLEGGTIARLVYPSFNYNDAEKKKIDGIFAEIREKKARDLIIDIRGNGGGNSLMGDYIFHYFQGPEKRASTSFSGRVWLMVDSRVFSSAVIFTSLFRDSRAGKIIGTETGGTATHFGEVRMFTLKNSGIPFGVSTKRFFSIQPRPGDDQHGILPDVPLNRRVLAEFKTEDDPALAYTLRYIQGR